MPHERWQEAAAAYALDSLDRADREEFEQHLGECADCRLAVQQFSEVTGLLVHASPARRAPVTLRQRVTRLVREDPGQGRGRFAPRAMLPWLAAAASITLAISAGLFARRNLADARALQERIVALDDSITARDSVLGYLTGPEVHVVSLAAAGEKPVARVFWNHTRQRYIVTAFDLPPARPGRTYQLWAIAEGKAPVSMGTFDTDANGDAVAVLPVSAEIEQLGFINLCALTQEPAGGSPQPTETPALSGEWRHTD